MNVGIYALPPPATRKRRNKRDVLQSSAHVNVQITSNSSFTGVRKVRRLLLWNSHINMINAIFLQSSWLNQSTFLAQLSSQLRMSGRWNLMRTQLHSRCPSLAILKTYPYMRYRSVMCHFIVKHVTVCRVQSNIFLCHLNITYRTLFSSPRKGKRVGMLVIYASGSNISFVRYRVSPLSCGKGLF